MAHSTSRFPLAASLAIGASCFLACVGNNPTPSADDDDDGAGETTPDSGASGDPSGSSGAGGSSGTGGSSGSSGASGSSGTVGTSSSSGGVGASSSSSGGEETDAGSDATTPPPPVQCVTPVMGAGAYVNRCRANRNTTVASGGAIPQGDYLLSGWWACNGNSFVQGSAILYPENGRFLMRYDARRFDSEANKIDEVGGTYSLDTSAGNAQVVRTEECRVGHVGDSAAGFYVYDATKKTLVLKLADHDEEWTRQDQ